jgi:hypothetical protein
MARKTETPKERHRDPNADATSEPWQPRGKQNSPGKRPGPPSPAGHKRSPNRGH